MVNVLEALWANGARLLDETGRPFPEPARARESLAFLRGLIESGVSPAWVTAADEELTRRPFGDGRAIFLRGWPYALDLFELPGLARARQGGRGADPAPAPRPGRRRLHRRRAPGGERAHPAPRTLAVALARFLTSEPAQRAMTEGAALRPSRPALYRDAGADRARSEPARAPRPDAPRPPAPDHALLPDALHHAPARVLRGPGGPQVPGPRDARRHRPDPAPPALRRAGCQAAGPRPAGPRGAGSRDAPMSPKGEEAEPQPELIHAPG